MSIILDLTAALYSAFCVFVVAASALAPLMPYQLSLFASGVAALAVGAAYLSVGRLFRRK